MNVNGVVDFSALDPVSAVKASREHRRQRTLADMRGKMHDVRRSLIILLRDMADDIEESLKPKRRKKP